MPTQPSSKEEQIGFHKGSIAVLSQEQQELLKIISVTNQLMQMHIEALKKFGIDYVAEAKKAYEEYQKRKGAPEQKSPNQDELADRLS